MKHPLTHCSIDHVLRAWPFAPDTSRQPYGPLNGPEWGLASGWQRRHRRACTGWPGRRNAKLNLITPFLELPTCPRCQVLWDLDQELRQEVTS